MTYQENLAELSLQALQNGFDKGVLIGQDRESIRNHLKALCMAVADHAIADTKKACADIYQNSHGEHYNPATDVIYQRILNAEVKA